MSVQASSLYQPLDPSRSEIRLIEILQGEPTDAIRCNLTTVGLHELPIFAALSYVWGDEADGETIYLNGHAVQATRNLGAALRHLRQPAARPYRLWVDAICIEIKRT